MNRFIYIWFLLIFPCLIPSALATWLSPDPLSDKYPNISPYAYCNWNPVKYTDPDGRKLTVLPSVINPDFLHIAKSQLNELKRMDPELTNMITSLELSPMDFYIEYNKNNEYNPITNTIGYDPHNDMRTDGEIRPPVAALAHELGHAENDKKGTSVDYDKCKANGITKTTLKERAKEQDKQNRNEQNPIYYENIVRENKKYPQRGYNYSNGD